MDLKKYFFLDRFNILIALIHDFIYSIMSVYKKFHHTIANYVKKCGINLNILEIPTTTGTLANILQKDHYVTTMDISRKSLHIALKKNSNIKTAVFNAYNRIPCSDNFFDMIVSTHLLYLLKGNKNILKEYHRTLKDNGFLIITEYDGYKSFLQIARKLDIELLILKIGDIIYRILNFIKRDHYVTLKSLHKLLIQHNFDILESHKTFGTISNTIIARKCIRKNKNTSKEEVIHVV